MDIRPFVSVSRVIPRVKLLTAAPPAAPFEWPNPGRRTSRCAVKRASRRRAACADLGPLVNRPSCSRFRRPPRRRRRHVVPSPARPRSGSQPSADEAAAPLLVPQVLRDGPERADRVVTGHDALVGRFEEQLEQPEDDLFAPPREQLLDQLAVFAVGNDRGLAELREVAGLVGADDAASSDQRIEQPSPVTTLTNIRPCAYQKVNLSANPQVLSRDLNVVHEVNSLCRSTDADVVASVVPPWVARMGRPEGVATIATLNGGRTAALLFCGPGPCRPPCARLVRVEQPARRAFRPRAVRTDGGDLRPLGSRRYCLHRAA
jgi:hypothetical protein